MLDKMKPYCLFPRTPGLFSSLNVQKDMLKDNERINKFKETIFKNVKKGDIVIDLGTGTGILAIWAAQAGAKKVYAIEETDVAELAKSVVKANGYESTIEIIQANSSEITLPEKADVLISELIGHFIFEEGIVEYVVDARNNLLKPDSKLIPSKAIISLAPVSLGSAFTEVSYWDTWKDPDLSSIKKRASNSAYVENIYKENSLSRPGELFTIDFASIQKNVFQAECSFLIERNGYLDAFAGWFRLNLDSDIYIDTSPWAETTHWKQTIFPLENPLLVNVGDKINFDMIIEPYGAGTKWKWGFKMTKNNKEVWEDHVIPVLYDTSFRLMTERF